MLVFVWFNVGSMFVCHIVLGSCFWVCFLFQDVPMLFVCVVCLDLKHKRWCFDYLHFVVFLFLFVCVCYHCNFVMFWFLLPNKRNSPKGGNSENPPKWKMHKKGLSKIAVSTVVLTNSALLLVCGVLKNCCFCWNHYKIVVSAKTKRHQKCNNKLCLKLVQGCVKNWSKHIAQNNLDQCFTQLFVIIWFSSSFCMKMRCWQTKKTWTSFSHKKGLILDQFLTLQHTL